MQRLGSYMLYILEPKSGDLEFLVGKFMSCIGRFSCCKFRTFFTEVNVAKSSDISRNMLQSIDHNVNICQPK